MSQIAIIRLKRVEESVGLKRSTIYDRLNPKHRQYDPTFPKPVPIGLRAIGWIESEVQDYLAARVASSRGTAA